MRPEPEIDLSIDEIRACLKAVDSRLAAQAITSMTSGWDNHMYRIGQDYIFRSPRREVAIPLLENEIRHSSQINKAISLQTPIMVKHGLLEISNQPWALQKYIPGTPVGRTEFRTRSMARCWCTFLKELHTLSMTTLSHNPHRGVPLKNKVDDFNEYLMRLEKIVPHLISNVQQQWDVWSDIPIETKLVTLHGDLHPWNILKDNEQIVAVIDWGDMTKGDPATDLASIFYYFPNEQLQKDIFDDYRASRQTVLRAKGWALYIFVALLAHTKEHTETEFFERKIEELIS